MIEAAEIVSYGRAASTALAAAVAKTKEQGPLHPVTVIVPSNFVGLSARRILGSEDGIANVSFLTPFRLAERLASGLLLEQLPLTNPALGAAVRRALAEDPGPYRQVSEHEATETALAALFRELSEVDDQGLESIASEGEQAGAVAVKFYHAIKSHLGRFHTEKDLAAAAADRADLVVLVAELGHVIWYLPAPASAAISRLVGRVLSASDSCDVIVGLTGSEPADKPVLDVCYAADVVLAPTPKHNPDASPGSFSDDAQKLASADSIISVTDADEEIRAVVRQTLALLAQGTRADRIGVFYPAPDPYVRIIEQQFADAAIAANGPDRRRLADSVAGRTLLAALALPTVRWRRDMVMALISGAPVRQGKEPARPAAWELISRKAGVLRDLSDWERKLDSYQNQVRRRLERLPAEDNSSYQALRLDGDLADATQLDEFVKSLASSVAEVNGAKSWPEKCEAAKTLLSSLLGPENTHLGWPESEQDALVGVIDALSRLSALDEMEPAPASAVFLRALTAELDVARSRRGRFGDGLTYGPLASAVGHDLDAVFIVGCAEGLLPIPRRDDAILPDRVRKLTLDQLELKSARIHHQHRQFLAAVSSAPAGSRTLLFPRGDLRSNRRALPSRWLLDSASALAGHKVYATDFEEAEQINTVASYASGIRTSQACTANDRILQQVGSASELGHDPASHPLAAKVSSGLEMQIARASTSFTEFDGNLAGQPIPGTTDQGGQARSASASRLETWATCGFKYFLSYVLELSERDEPESVEEISALDRGSLVHEVLERFIAGALASSMPQPHEPWSEQHQQRLFDIAEEVFADYEDRGKTGRPVYWEVKKKDLIAVLEQFIVADNQFRAANGATPAEVELPFGLKGSESLDIPLVDGRVLKFRGLADRLDTTTDGRVIVSDYKSGKAKKFKELDDDPVNAGKTLQLGLYAHAALRHTGLDKAEAHYWMLDAAPKDRRLGYPWTQQRNDRFIEVLTTISDGIAAGVFAAQPGEWDTFRGTNETCTYCEFNSLCPRARGDHALAMNDAPELAIRHGLYVGDGLAVGDES